MPLILYVKTLWETGKRSTYSSLPNLLSVERYGAHKIPGQFLNYMWRGDTKSPFRISIFLFLHWNFDACIEEQTSTPPKRLQKQDLFFLTFIPVDFFHLMAFYFNAHHFCFCYFFLGLLWPDVEYACRAPYKKITKKWQKWAANFH